MYFFSENNVDLKYTSLSLTHKVEVYLKYIGSMKLIKNYRKQKNMISIKGVCTV